MMIGVISVIHVKGRSLVTRSIEKYSDPTTAVTASKYVVTVSHLL